MVRGRCGHDDGVVVRQWRHEYSGIARRNDHDAVFNAFTVERRRDLPRRQLSDAAWQLQGKSGPVAMGCHEQYKNVVVLVHDTADGVHRLPEVLKISERYSVHRLAVIDESYRALDRQDAGDRRRAAIQLLDKNVVGPTRDRQSVVSVSPLWDAAKPANSRWSNDDWAFWICAMSPRDSAPPSSAWSGDKISHLCASKLDGRSTGACGITVVTANTANHRPATLLTSRNPACIPSRPKETIHNWMDVLCLFSGIYFRAELEKEA